MGNIEYTPGQVARLQRQDRKENWPDWELKKSCVLIMVKKRAVIPRYVCKVSNFGISSYRKRSFPIYTLKKLSMFKLTALLAPQFTKHRLLGWRKIFLEKRL